MFVPGAQYSHRWLVEKYGGQWQQGIVTPKGKPYLFLFSGPSGAQYGYKDHWEAGNTIFYYTGEGQEGDMAFVRGNRAIRDHAENGKDLHLFEYVSGGLVEYRGQMVVTGHDMRRGPDRNGNERDVIVFELVRVDEEPVEVQEAAAGSGEAARTSLSLAELRELALTGGLAPLTPIERRQRVYERSAKVRAYARERAAGRCEACAGAAPFMTTAGAPYLEVHHLRSVTDNGPDHPEWVAAVCPNCHRRAHYGSDGVEFNQRLLDVIAEFESRLAALGEELPPLSSQAHPA